MTLLRMEVTNSMTSIRTSNSSFRNSLPSRFYLFQPQEPLVAAIITGNIEEVENILENNPEAVSVLDPEKRSPLHVASYMGYAEIVELLITKGNARVNCKDNQWLTPLHRACRSNAEVNMFDCRFGRVLSLKCLYYIDKMRVFIVDFRHLNDYSQYFTDFSHISHF